MPDGNGDCAWHEEMGRRMEALEKAHRELEDALIVLTHVETRMSQLVKEQAEYVANHEKRLREAEERDQRHREAEQRLDQRIDNLVSAIADLISRIPPDNLRQQPGA